MGKTMQFQDADIASFLLYLYRYQLLDIKAAVKWADYKIKESETRPDWVNELSLAKDEPSIVDILLGLSLSAKNTQKLILAFLKEKWLRRDISYSAMEACLYDLPEKEALEEYKDGYADWASMLASYLDDFTNDLVQGEKNVSELEKFFDDTFDRFIPDDQILEELPWLR